MDPDDLFDNSQVPDSQLPITPSHNSRLNKSTVVWHESPANRIKRSEFQRHGTQRVSTNSKEWWGASDYENRFNADSDEYVSDTEDSNLGVVDLHDGSAIFLSRGREFSENGPIQARIRDELAAIKRNLEEVKKAPNLLRPLLGTSDPEMDISNRLFQPSQPMNSVQRPTSIRVPVPPIREHCNAGPSTSKATFNSAGPGMTSPVRTLLSGKRAFKESPLATSTPISNKSDPGSPKRTKLDDSFNDPKTDELISQHLMIAQQTSDPQPRPSTSITKTPLRRVQTMEARYPSTPVNSRPKTSISKGGKRPHYGPLVKFKTLTMSDLKKKSPPPGVAAKSTLVAKPTNKPPEKTMEPWHRSKSMQENANDSFYDDDDFLESLKP